MNRKQTHLTFPTKVQLQSFNEYGKLDDRAQEGVYVGYYNKPKGYRVSTKQNKIIIKATNSEMDNQISRFSSFLTKPFPGK